MFSTLRGPPLPAGVIAPEGAIVQVGSKFDVRPSVCLSVRVTLSHEITQNEPKRKHFQELGKDLNGRKRERDTTDGQTTDDGRTSNLEPTCTIAPFGGN